MPRGKRGRRGGRGIVKSVSQPARVVRTPTRGRVNAIANQVLQRMALFEPQGPSASGLQPGPGPFQQRVPDQVSQPVHGPFQQGQEVPEPMEVNVDRVNAPAAAGRHVDGEQMDLTGRFDPDVPGPLAQARQDDDGWAEIDKLGAWDCALSPFPAIEEIPAQHREAWFLAMEKVHRKIWEAQDVGEDLDRALKWWFFLPQALCRRAQRGGRAGVGQIKKRFNCIVKGDYGEVVQGQGVG